MLRVVAYATRADLQRPTLWAARWRLRLHRTRVHLRTQENP